MVKLYRFSFLIFFLMLTVSSVSGQQVYINEIVSSNDASLTDQFGANPDWIEFFNSSNDTISLLGYGLSDNPSSRFKWVFPDVKIAPGAFMVVFASGNNLTASNARLHTNFRLSSSGETLLLTRPDSVLEDSVSFGFLLSDVSFGRSPNGGSMWYFFQTPTPGASNLSTTYNEILEPVEFSHQSGVYTDTLIHLTLSHPDPGATIIYTLDGSIPDPVNLQGTTYSYKNDYPISSPLVFGPLLTRQFQSFQYSSPLSITNRNAKPNQIAQIRTSIGQGVTIPQMPIRKGTVVRAIAVKNGAISPHPQGRSYFLWPDGFNYNFPIISMQVQENHFFDYSRGTYVPGMDYDTMAFRFPQFVSNWLIRNRNGNYKRGGPEWEHPAHLELLNTAGATNFSRLNGGFRIHGNDSRGFPHKNLRFYFRSSSDYADAFQHTLFPPTASGDPNNFIYKRLMLHTHGSGGSKLNDYMWNRIFQPIYDGAFREQIAVKFVNGEYWGLTTIRDRFDRYHFANNYRLNADSISIVGFDGRGIGLTEGRPADYIQYLQMRSFIINSNLANDSVYRIAESMLDPVTLTDHMIAHSYTGNTHYEGGFWICKQVDTSAIFGDKRWRALSKDFDQTGATGATYNSLLNVQPMLIGMLKNSGFRNYYLNRNADLLNTVLLPSHVQRIMNATMPLITPYNAENQSRWGAFTYAQGIANNGWMAPLNAGWFMNYCNIRPAAFRTQINTYFQLSGSYNASLFVSNPAHGHIKINSINVKAGTPGVPDKPYPWTGTYFRNVPITLSGIPAKGYRFSHWSGDTFSTAPTIVINRSSNFNIQANFEPLDFEQELIHFWMINNDVPNNLPLDSLVARYSLDDSRAVIRFQSCLPGYPFTATHPNWRKSSMERRNAPTPLNYFEAGNNNTPYAANDMRGIQIRQAFRNGNRENTLFLHLSTLNRKDITISLAMMDEQAADRIQGAYWNDQSQTWDTLNMPQSTFTLSSDYAVLSWDLKQVAQASNNPDLRFRWTFSGNNMLADNGNRVTFNNVAVHGTKINAMLPGQKQVLYYWLMDNNLPNDLPLTGINSTYSKTGATARLDYYSCLVGYPFTSTHPDWRKSSMERRNDPTPVNYFPVANNDAPYGSFVMRGLQIKQAFRRDDKENELHFRFSSIGHTDLSFSFAAKDDAGAAQHLMIEYLDSTGNWQHVIQNSTQFPLTGTYRKYAVELSHIPQMNNNPICSLRVRFGGNNMTAENGQRVTFNNIAVEGKPFSVACEPVIPIVCNDTVLICPGEKVNSYLFGGAPGVISWQVTPSSGVSKAAGTSTSTGELMFTRRGTYTISFTSTNSNTPVNCFPESVSMCKRVVIVSGDTTLIDAIPPLCGLETASPLPATSTTGIPGSWSPAFSNQASAIYTFTPDSGYCLTAVDVPLVIVPPVIPAFDTIANICIGDTLPAFPTASLNGIDGVWSPAPNNQATTIYTFTPDSGQCARSVELMVKVIDCTPILVNAKLNNEVKVFPNPFVSNVTLSAINTPIKEVIATDILGKIVYRQKMQDDVHNFSLPLLALPPGQYLLKVRTQTDTQVFRLVKQANME